MLPCGMLLFLSSLSACNKAPQLRGRISALNQISQQAEQHGAMTCAPRELAVARAYTQFADLALQRGALSTAEAHIKRAELNAAAAHLQSPALYCQDSLG